MIVIGTIIFPEEQENDVADCYQNLPQAPEFIEVKATYVYNNPGEAHRAFSIFQFEEKFLEEANAYFEARYKAFGEVEGLTFKYEEWLDIQEALAIVAEGSFDLDLKSI